MRGCNKQSGGGGDIMPRKTDKKSAQAAEPEQDEVPAEVSKPSSTSHRHKPPYFSRVAVCGQSRTRQVLQSERP